MIEAKILKSCRIANGNLVGELGLGAHLLLGEQRKFS